jgi:DNA-binding protein HU-beta
MTKLDIIDHLTYNCGLQRSSAIAAVEGTMKCIAMALADNKNVTLRGFGTFKVVKVAEKKGRNIAAKTEIIIPAHHGVKFIPSAELKSNLKSVEE